MRIALAQLRCEKGDLAGNLAAHARHIAAAGARGVDILCFPEMSLTGYGDPARYPHAVIALDGPEVAALLALTRGCGMTVLAGIEEFNPDGKSYITQLVACDGDLRGWYRKLTVVDEEADWFSSGDDVPVFEHDGVRFGVAVCADIDNPEIFRRAARQGARIVFHPSAPGLYGDLATRDWRAGFEWWRGECREMLGHYAREHGLYIATSTQAGRTVDEDFPGGGYVFGPRGECLAETLDWSEGVLDAEVEL